MTARRASHDERAGFCFYREWYFYPLTTDLALLLFPGCFREKKSLVTIGFFANCELAKKVRE